MAKIIAVANQKGGVGKTTTSVSLAASLSESGLRPNVLLIDLDPQGNATMGVGVNKYELARGIDDVLLGEIDIADAICELEEKSLRLVGANTDLTGVEVLLAQKENGAFSLKEALEKIKNNFDYIILDCPPSLSMLTLNGLTAATDLLVPVQCEYYALEGISALVETMERVRESTNPSLQLLGVLRTMYDGRNSLAVQVSNEVVKYFGEKVFEAIVPRNVRLAEAPSYGEPITVYDKRSKGAEAYMALAQEVIQRSRVRG